MNKENSKSKNINLTKLKNISIKSIAVVLAVVIGIMLCFFMTGCDDKSNYLAGEDLNARYFDEQHIFLDAGETYKPDIKEIFKHLGINISSYEVSSYSGSIATVSKNVVTAKASGVTSLSCILYEKSTKRYYAATFAYVYVIDEANMIPITTAQQLYDIRNDMNGHYILKNDIDLNGWGQWTPIGNMPNESPFEGVFVNKGGFKISNLTITPSGTNDVIFGGLFGTNYGYIDGILLENVNISLLTCESNYSWAGAIADSSWGVIANCDVKGEISAKLSSGGICGNNYGKILNCSFKGNVTTTNDVDNPNASAGGIAAFCRAYGIILNCNVTGYITSTWIGGGILGYTDGTDQNISKVEGCTFKVFNDSGSMIGFIYAPIPGWIIGLRKDRSSYLGER